MPSNSMRLGAFGVILFSASISYAFFDFIGAQALRVMEVGAYVSTASDLIKEVTGSNEVEKGAKEVQRRTELLKKSSDNLKYMSETSRSVLAGPDWSSKRLDENIKSTTNYIKRVKKIVAKSMALGTTGLTALNSTETNISLNEIQKNQQAIIIQNEDSRLRELERESENRKEWINFSLKQRQIRENRTNGKPY